MSRRTVSKKLITDSEMIQMLNDLFDGNSGSEDYDDELNTGEAYSYELLQDVCK